MRSGEKVFPRLIHVSEPQLEFGFHQKTTYPRDGLYMFGPITPEEVTDIDYGVIGTPDGLDRFRRWAKKISRFVGVPAKTQRSRDIEPQHVPFPGFEEVFGARWNSNPRVSVGDIELRDIEAVLRIENRHEAVKRTVDLFVEGLVREQNRLEKPPAFWFVVIPEIIYSLGRPQSHVPKSERIRGEVRISLRQASSLKVQPSLFPEDEKDADVYNYSVNFRRQLKARLLDDRIVTQIVRETTLAPNDFLNSAGQPSRRIEDAATIAWKLATAAYYKAGGKPWQLADVRPGVCYVGLVYKNIETTRDERHACCAAQMFLSDGEGVVFRGALGPWYSPNTKQFHLDRRAAHDLVQMVLEEYQRLKGSYPAELFFHAKAAFTRDEWAGVESAAPENTKVIGVQIRDARNEMKLYRQGNYPVVRGTAVLLDNRSAYLWTSGYVARLDTYMGPETPNPILVRVQRGDCSLETVLSDVMALTKINYNSCLFNDRAPVTIRFADAIGDVITSAPLGDNAKLPFKYYI